MTEWKNIIGYEGIYMISNAGKVKSIARQFIKTDGRKKIINELIRIPSINHRGYERLQLTSFDGYKKIFSIHRLVAQAFIPNPLNKPEVNHKNGVKTDNHINNLEWCTKKENELHALMAGLKPAGENHPMAKLRKANVVLIKNMIKNGIKLSEISHKFKVSIPTISAIKTKRIWANT